MKKKYLNEKSNGTVEGWWRYRRERESARYREDVGGEWQRVNDWIEQAVKLFITCGSPFQRYKAMNMLHSPNSPISIPFILAPVFPGFYSHLFVGCCCHCVFCTHNCQWLGSLILILTDISIEKLIAWCVWNNGKKYTLFTLYSVEYSNGFRYFCCLFHLSCINSSSHSFN